MPFIEKIGLVSKDILGMEVTIKNDKEICVNEVKRTGLLIDRGEDIQIRLCDTLILYLSEQKFE